MRRLWLPSRMDPIAQRQLLKSVCSTVVEESQSFAHCEHDVEYEVFGDPRASSFNFGDVVDQITSITILKDEGEVQPVRAPDMFLHSVQVWNIFANQKKGFKLVCCLTISVGVGTNALLDILLPIAVVSYNEDAFVLLTFM